MAAKRVGIYLRVSTTDQTVENQRHDLKRVAEQRGWEVVGEYIDHGISGTKGREKRPGYDRLAKDAAKGKLDMVAAWSIDRLGRNLGHLVQFTDELRQQEVGLYLHQQSVDTSTSAGRAFLQMAGVFAEFERNIIVERINSGIARARSQGKHLGRPTTVTAKTEQEIRRLRATGMGKRKIATTLRCGTWTVQRVLA
ncbi:MAG TPA: recombinase family protein [Steroidobacteraceae bacterium]|jgi:DNA invertase Pin-like site-specific DNA recombinase